MVDKLISKANTSITIGSSSWKEQFIEAITVSAGLLFIEIDLFYLNFQIFRYFIGDDDDDDEKIPTCSDYVMHFFTLFWKLLFAFVPPTGLFYNFLKFFLTILILFLP